MKLIQILVLATAMATLATAQNSGANNASSTGQQPTDTTTPAAAKKPASSGKATAPAKTKKTSPATATKATSPATKGTGNGSQTATKKPSSPGTSSPNSSAKSASTTKSGAASGATVKPPVVTGALTGKGKATPAGQTATARVATKKGSSPVKPKPGGKAPVVSAVKPKTTTTPAKPSGASGKGVPTVPAKVAAVPPPAGVEKKPPRTMGAAGRRDPFVSPIRNLGNVGPSPNCTSGKKCLSIPELILQGTVKDISGKMMAVVVTSSQHTYTLRENDQVFNGSVEKITTDSIIFREYVKDALGRETAREVVKKIVPTS